MTSILKNSEGGSTPRLLSQPQDGPTLTLVESIRIVSDKKETTNTTSGDNREKELTDFEQWFSDVNVRKNQLFICETHFKNFFKKRKDVLEVTNTKLNDRHIRADSNWLSAWNSVCNMCILITTFLGIYMVCFDSSPYVKMLSIAYLCDFVELLNIGHEFFLSYYDKRGLLIVDRQVIKWNYLKGSFFLDLLATIPFEIFSLWISAMPWSHTVSLLRLNRVLRFWKTLRFFEKQDDKLGSYTMLLRTLKYITICLVVTHFTTCGWFSMACKSMNNEVHYFKCEHDSWVDNSHFSLGFNMTESSTAEAYLVSLYWAVETATSTGYGDIYAINSKEMAFSIGTMLLGIAVFFGMLLGGMASMITSLYQQRADYAHRYHTIKDHLKDEKIEDDICTQVVNYYKYFWSRKKGVEMDGVYEDLPITYRTEIYESTNDALLKMASIFDGISVGLMRMLALQVQYKLFLPGQIIVSKGDIGHEMFYISKGELEVLSEQDDCTAVAILRAGHIFGEIGLIFRIPRVSTVRAKTYCELLVLDREVMNPLLSNYPAVMEDLRKTATMRINKALKIKDLLKMVEDMNSKLKNFKGEFTVQSTTKTATFEILPQKVDVEAAGLPRKLHFLVRMKNIYEKETITRNGRTIRLWHYTVIIAVMIYSLYYPYLFCYATSQTRRRILESSLNKLFFGISYLCDLIFLLDIFVKRRTHVVTEHVTLEQPTDIAHHYQSSTVFVIDMISVLPLELLWNFYPDFLMGFLYLRLIKLIKLIQIPHVFVQLEEDLDIKVGRIRWIKFILAIAIMTHWMAGVLYLAACYDDSCFSDMFIDLDMSGGSNQTNSAYLGYVVSLYMACATLTSVGYGDFSGNDTISRITSQIIMFLGMITYGYALAVMAATLATADAFRVSYQGRLLAIRNYMQEHDLKSKIEQRVISYLCLLWDKHKGIWMPGMSPILHDVPKKLQENVLECRTFSAINKCPLFKDTNTIFLKELAIETESYLFTPGEILVYAGDRCLNMYCIKQGYCQVCTCDTERVLFELGPNDYIGACEMLYGDYHPFTVVAMTYVEVLEIKESGLKHLLKQFPTIRNQFKSLHKKKPVYDQYKEKHKSVDVNMDQIDIHPTETLVNVGKLRGLAPDPFKSKAFISFKNCSKQLKEEFIDGYKQDKAFLSYFMMKLSFNPLHRAIQMYSHFFIIVSVIQGFLIPIHAAFCPRDNNMMIFLYILDFLQLINMYFKAHVAYYNKSDVVLVLHPRYTIENYLHSGLVLDFYGVLPLELFLFLGGAHFFAGARPTVAMMRVNRLLYMYQIPLVVDHVEASVNRKTHWIRSIKFGLYMAMFLNFTTCVFYMLAVPPYFGVEIPSYLDNVTAIVPGSWLHDASSSNNINLTEASQSMYTMYLISLYWATATTVTVGYGDIGANLPNEMIVCLLFMIFGMIFFGYMVASIAAAMTSADSERATYAEKIKSIRTHMKDYEVPEDLQTRITEHYKQLYRRTKGYEATSLFQVLPQSLWGDVSLALYQERIRKIEMFEDVDDAFVKMLCMMIKPIIFLRGELILHQGDIGNEMFFIHSGTVSVESPNNPSQIHDTMTEGQAFGEVALLYACRRTAHVRAVNNCDLLMLTKTDMDLAMAYYPKTKAIMEKIARERHALAQKRAMHYPLSQDMYAKYQEEKQDDVNVLMLTKSSHISLTAPEDEEDLPDELTPRIAVRLPSLLVAFEPGHINENINNHASGHGYDTDPENKKDVYMPYTMSKKVYDSFMCVVFIASTAVVVYQAAFQEHHPILLLLNYVLDLLFVIHMIVKLHTAYYTSYGDLVTDKNLVKLRYLKNRSSFLRDILSIIPLEVLALVAPHESQFMVSSLFRINRLLRIANVQHYFRKLEESLDVRLFFVRFLHKTVELFFYVHIISALWYMVACLPWNDGYCVDGSWVDFSREMESSLHKYCTSVYWCLATITSTGYGDQHAYTKIEMALSVFVMIFGKMVLGFVLGDVAVSLQNSEASRDHYNLKVQWMQTNMEDCKITQSLQERVSSYMNYIWRRQKIVDVQTMFEDCPLCLHIEVYLHIAGNMLSSIRLLDVASHSFLRQLSIRVKHQQYMPYGTIINMGDVPPGVWFIRRGKVDLYRKRTTEEQLPTPEEQLPTPEAQLPTTDEDGTLVVETLKENDVFGDVHLIRNVVCDFTAIAITHVDMFSLSRENFEDVLSYFPLFADKIEQNAKDLFDKITRE